MFCQKVFMFALFNYLTICHDDYAVGSADGGQAMGNDNTCPVGKGLSNGAFDKNLGLAIDVGGGFIQNQYAWVAGQDTGQGKELFFTRR